ncbi:TonB-dependent receptor [Runella aurantiaca]|uniref:TonB-dependent receptor n=1 Tax=Runella aurantiaca TaxID=2282308 RepID=A0A369IAG4_9BACT|nr:TonB-dependent receptor plug domain-containing protein [Runella aurantiaca]RDB05457.1 TonB-dependent receptor [Runella aurantiaca]
MKRKTRGEILITMLLVAVFLVFSGDLYAQKITISGTVKDKLSGEKLNGIKIYVGNNFVETNKFGYYNLLVPTQKAMVTFFSENYKSLNINVQNDTILNIELEKLNFDLEEVVIKAEKDSYADRQGNFSLPIEWIKKRPTILGEADIMKAIQFLPGIQAGTEGTSGIYVRGGSPDQTMILVDGVPVYNVYHFFGFFSVFNPDAVSAVKIYKNDLPARYGGRLSSVIDLTMREGNNKERKSSFSVSPISGKFSLEGPIKKGKASYIITGRKTWLDLITTSLQRATSNGSFLAYSFYDLNAKVNYELTKKDHLYISLYTGRDLFKNQDKIGNLESNKYQFDWGNHTVIGRWNRIISQKLFKNTTLSYTKYSYNIENEIKSRRESFYSKIRSDIRDWAIKTDFEYLPSVNHTTRFGFSFTNHRFAPEILQVKEEGTTPTVQGRENPPVDVQDLQSYIEQTFQINAHLNFNGGLHYNALWVNNKFYHSLQPRINVNYDFSKSWGIRAAFFNTYQYLHLLTNSSLGLPTDLWVPITDKIPPQSANQLSVGISKKWGSWVLSADLYYKKMNNQLEYGEGTSFLNDLSGRWFDKVVIGTGESKGIEFFLQKTRGKMTGFVSYTLSKTTRTFQALNEGVSFPYKYDRTHNLSLNTSYNFNKRRELSFVFSLMSGSLLSLPTSRFSGIQPSLYGTNLSIQAAYLNYFNQLGELPNRNNFRLPLYHRLDFNYRASKPKKRGERTWIFSVYNAYNRQNAFFIYPENGKLKQFSLFPIVPSLGYERRF